MPNHVHRYTHMRTVTRQLSINQHNTRKAVPRPKGTAFQEKTDLQAVTRNATGALLDCHGKDHRKMV